MNKDYTLGFVSGLLAAALASLCTISILAAFGKVHIYGAGATGIGRLLCIW